MEKEVTAGFDGSAFVSLCLMVSAQVFGLHLFGMLKWDVKIGPVFGAIRIATTEKLLQNVY